MKYAFYTIAILAWLAAFICSLYIAEAIPQGLIVIPGICIGMKIYQNEKIKNLKAENEHLKQKLHEYENQWRSL